MNKKKKALGSNPLEAYLAAKTTKKASTSSEIDETDANAGLKKQRITIHLPIETIEKIKNVVFWEPGFTLTAFAQEAFERAVQELEKERGEPYPKRKERSLKGGRPLI